MILINYRTPLNIVFLCFIFISILREGGESGGERINEDYFVKTWLNALHSYLDPSAYDQGLMNVMGSVTTSLLPSLRQYF